MNANPFTIGEVIIVSLAAKVSNTSPGELLKSAGILGALVCVSKAIAYTINSGDYLSFTNQVSQVIEESQKPLRDEIEALSKTAGEMSQELDQLRRIVTEGNKLPFSEMRRLGITYANGKFHFQQFQYENLDDAIAYAKTKAKVG